MSTLFKGGIIVSPTGEKEATDLLIDGKRIVKAGSIDDADQIVDVAGKHLLPGLFDCHVHMSQAHTNFIAFAATHPGYRYYSAIPSLRSTLECGITTVRDAGGADQGMKKAINHGLIKGPRMHISITMLSQTGGHGDSYMQGGSHLFCETAGGSFTYVVDGADPIMVRARELIRDGADVLKVATSGGILSADDPRHAHYRLHELKALVAEADAAGIPVMAHAHGPEGIKNAIKAGMRSIEHGSFIDEECVQMLLDNNVWLVPTLSAGKAAGAHQKPGSKMAKKAENATAQQKDNFRKAVEAGVKVAMGTDCPVSPHGSNLGELELMVDFGMTPQQALYAATMSAAELMGLDDQLGSLEEGKLADVVVVDGDPFDFPNLKDNIVSVWKEGHKLVDNNEKRFVS